MTFPSHPDDPVQLPEDYPENPTQEEFEKAREDMLELLDRVLTDTVNARIALVDATQSLTEGVDGIKYHIYKAIKKEIK
jgi:lantibiotic modifying enzyme